MYASLTYYRNTYVGRICSDDTELTRLLTRASNAIDLYCAYGFTYADLTTQFKSLIDSATCAEAENYLVNGDGLDTFSSASLGAFSFSGGKQKSAPELSDNCLKYLYLTGYAFRGVQQCSKFRVEC